MKELLPKWLSAEQAQGFELYYELLTEANGVMNLTAITGREEVARLHFCDSLAVLDFEGVRKMGAFSVIDIGSGAGFPGVPMKLARPELKLTLLDSQSKRVEFLRMLCARLGVEAELVCARAEEAALKPPLRDGFDLAVSRAVARLGMLTELCLPLVRPGGYLLAMKSASADEEKVEAARTIRLLGGELMPDHPYKIPGVDADRRLVVIKKTSPTPPGYPRRFAKIKSAPL